jgi:hypothetical protein
MARAAVTRMEPCRPFQTPTCHAIRPETHLRVLNRRLHVLAVYNATDLFLARTDVSEKDATVFHCLHGASTRGCDGVHVGRLVCDVEENENIKHIYVIHDGAFFVSRI